MSAFLKSASLVMLVFFSLCVRESHAVDKGPGQRCLSHVAPTSAYPNGALANKCPSVLHVVLCITGPVDATDSCLRPLGIRDIGINGIIHVTRKLGTNSLHTYTCIDPEYPDNLVSFDGRQINGKCEDPMARSRTSKGAASKRVAGSPAEDGSRDASGCLSKVESFTGGTISGGLKNGCSFPINFVYCLYELREPVISSQEECKYGVYKTQVHAAAPFETVFADIRGKVVLSACRAPFKPQEPEVTPQGIHASCATAEEMAALGGAPTARTRVDTSSRNKQLAGPPSGGPASRTDASKHSGATTLGPYADAIRQCAADPKLVDDIAGDRTRSDISIEQNRAGVISSAWDYIAIIATRYGSLDQAVTVFRSQRESSERYLKDPNLARDPVRHAVFAQDSLNYELASCAQRKGLRLPRREG